MQSIISGDAAGYELIETRGKVGGGRPRDRLVIIPKDGPLDDGEKECEGPISSGQIAKGDGVNRHIDLTLKIIDPKVIKIAEYYKAGAIWDQSNPVVERLLVVLL